MEPVVAVCVVALLFGAVNVNVTLAPEAASPLFITVALIGTVVGGVKLVPDTERLTASEGPLGGGGGGGGATPTENVALAAPA